MKDIIQSKIQEARDQGRDVPLVIEELFLALAGAMDGDKPDEKPTNKSAEV